MGFQYLLHVIILLLDIRQSIEIIIFHFQITFWWCSSIHFKSVIESKMMTMKMGMGKMMTAVALKNMLSWRREPFLFSICLSQTLPTSKHLGLSHFVSNLYSWSWWWWWWRWWWWWLWWWWWSCLWYWGKEKWWW